MAVFIYSAHRPSDFGSPGYGGQLLEHDESSAVVTAKAIADRIQYTGHDLVYDAESITGGIVTSYSYLVSSDSRYVPYLRVTDFVWDMAYGAPDIEDLLAGNDTIRGSSESLGLYGGAGDDVITTRSPSYIEGGTGNDEMQGSKGRDYFLFAVGDGTDRILDFGACGRRGDKIEIALPADAPEIEIVQLHGRVVIFYGDDDRIVLRGVHLADLSANDVRLSEQGWV